MRNDPSGLKLIYYCVCSFGFGYAFAGWFNLRGRTLGSFLAQGRGAFMICFGVLLFFRQCLSIITSEVHLLRWLRPQPDVFLAFRNISCIPIYQPSCSFLILSNYIRSSWDGQTAVDKKIGIRKLSNHKP
jgi:hypothetical protein